MRKILLSVITVAIISILTGAICSCSNDKNDDEQTQGNDLYGTIWIYKFKSEDNIKDKYAEALYFGKYKVEGYSLDSNMKILNTLGTESYSMKGNVLTIGIMNYSYGEGYGDNFLCFQGFTFYRTDKKLSDLLPNG